MSTHKISISLPKELYEFAEKYQKEHHLKSRSEVISEALSILEQNQLEACYLEANKELNNDFEITASDGLEDETW